MERVIEIIEEWGFKSGTKAHYYKFVTPDSYIRFYFEEDCLTITFIAFCGTRNEELTKVTESWKINKNVHRKYIFNE